jgi:hypothetical protein
MSTQYSAEEIAARAARYREAAAACAAAHGTPAWGELQRASVAAMESLWYADPRHPALPAWYRQPDEPAERPRARPSFQGGFHGPLTPRPTRRRGQ